MLIAAILAAGSVALPADRAKAAHDYDQVVMSQALQVPKS